MENTPEHDCFNGENAENHSNAWGLGACFSFGVSCEDWSPQVLHDAFLAVVWIKLHEGVSEDRIYPQSSTFFREQADD